MMVLKWIVCQVAEDQRAAFHRGQSAWRRLAGVEGLIGQAGGWDESTGRACVLALWKSQADYDRFMQFDHDGIYDASGQKGTFERCEILHAECLLPMEGEAGSLPDAIAAARMLRVADCRVAEDRREHFIDVQTRVWAPAMAESAGQLGGCFGVGSDDDHRFLVTTFWRSESLHRSYATERVPALREMAGVATDVVSLEGCTVTLEQDWRVIAEKA